MRIISIVTALALTQTGLLHGQQSGNNTLSKNPLYTEALTALTDHLPMIASEKFATLLADKATSDSLTEDQKVKLLFLLLESQVRANQANEAMVTLSDELISSHPDSFFWKGQALASLGRYFEAIETLEKATSKSKNYQLAQLSIANFAISLGDNDKALNILKRNIDKGEKLSTQSYLLLANLYLVKDQPLDAAKILEIVKPDTPTEAQAKQVLLAQVNILKKQYDQAITDLETVLASENLQSNTQNFAAIQLADALHASGKNQEAINTLLKYLDKQPLQFVGPMFTRLGKWIPVDTAITDPTIKQLITWANLEASQPTDPLSPLTNDQIDLRVFAHFYHARFLANKAELSSKTQAIQEFNNLRELYPTHILAGTALSEKAVTLLALDRVDEAKETLLLIQNLTTPIDPRAKQQAGFLLGKLNLDDQNYAQAATAYQAVVESSVGDIKAAATMNAASSYLADADLEGFAKLQEYAKDSTIQQSLELEHALWLARNNRPEARTILNEFIQQHSEDPRINDAYLSLALHCLNVSPTDYKLASLITPKIDPLMLTETQIIDLYYLKYRNAASQKDYDSAADIAQQLLDLFPDHPSVPEFTLYRGQALYHNGQHNTARQLLLNMVKTYPEHPLKDFAEYYAAMSAKLEGTPQATDEAILLLSKISQSDSNLASESRLQLARIYISINKPELAIEILADLYKKQPSNKKDLNLSVTLALAYRDLGDKDPKHFQSALEIYEALTKQFKGNDQVVNEIKYNKALLLQHMGQDEKALAIYYSVINVDTKTTPITEWAYYYKCGFRAITMLEKMDKPRAAIAIAEKLAASGGNRTQEAKDRARILEMKHMIWR